MTREDANKSAAECTERIQAHWQRITRNSAATSRLEPRLDPSVGNGAPPGSASIVRSLQHLLWLCTQIPSYDEELAIEAVGFVRGAIWWFTGIDEVRRIKL